MKRIILTSSILFVGCASVAQIPDNLKPSANESLALNAKIYGIDDASLKRTVDDLSEMLRVRDKLDVMVRELSLGERMRERKKKEIKRK